MHQTFYYLKYDVEYDISMTERPRLRPASEKRKQSLPKMKQYFCFLSISGIFCHMQCYTNGGVQENGCFTLEKQCFRDWNCSLNTVPLICNLIATLCNIELSGEKSLSISKYCLCCTILADNWNCNDASLFRIILQPSCNCFSIEANTIMLMRTAR